MPPEPTDTPLPLSPAAVIGGWLNDTPWRCHDGGVLRQESRWSFTANGGASLRNVGFFEVDGHPAFAEPIVVNYAGTWRIDNDTLIVQLVRNSTPSSDPLVLIERRTNDGEVRIRLKSGRGGVWWRTGST